MKTYITYLIIILAFIACKNDDYNNTGNPLDQLPPITTTGENTFGCLLDGEAFLPGGTPNPLDCVYQFINGEFYFGLQGNNRDELNNNVRISIGTVALELVEGEEFTLLENETGNAMGRFSYATNATYTSQNNSGVLKITRLDTENNIVSGTFSFDIIDFEGNLREIREGRFDMQYTN
jgi:hypothetical protein